MGTTAPPKSAAETFFERYTGLKLDEEEFEELHIGDLPRYLTWAPVSAVSIEDSDGVALTDEEDFYWDDNGGIVVPSPLASNVWIVAYTAGYSSIPEDIENILEALEDEWDATPALAGIRKERLGDYEYELEAKNYISSPLMRRLDSWKREIVW